MHVYGGAGKTPAPHRREGENMAVKLGSARGDENNGARGGKAGDQTGKEVSTQNWYKHSKGWRVFRAKSPEAAEKIAQDMQWACDNPHIGYDQDQRLTLYNAAKPYGFNCKDVTQDCETDCSALVRVCCAYAGIMLPNFTTANEPSVLLASGAFDELTGLKYTDSSDYLKRGDILDTRTQGHTVVVLSDGAKVNGGQGILRNGDEGEDVKAMQTGLIRLGYDCGRWGADGDFGDATEQALKMFQNDHGLEADGEYGPLSRAAMEKALAAIDKPTENPRKVKIVGGNCYVRSAPSKDGKKLGVVHDGDTLPYGGQTTDNGWNLVEFGNENGWVSGKYSRLEG